MKEHEEKSAKEVLRIEKLKAEEAKSQAKDQARTQTYLAREHELEKAQKIKDNQRAKERADEDIREQAKEKARKEAYQAREKAIAADQEARKLKNKTSQ